jgi:AcrR family transcriptional regulator
VSAVAPRRGRPRSEKSQQAILSAAAELLQEQGLNQLSVEAIADRAGASKATIYRWWPSKEVLALDALFSDWRSALPDEPDTGSLADDLLAMVGPWVRVLAARPYGGIIAGLIVRAQSDPDFAEAYRTRFVEPRRDQARAAFARAIERGEVARDTNVEVALDMLYGPIYHRVLQGHAPVGDDFARAVVDHVVRAVGAPPATSS